MIHLDNVYLKLLGANMDTLVDRMRSDKAVLFHQPKFKEFLEMHMLDLAKASKKEGRTFDISEKQRSRADKDFSFLCNIVGIPFDMHWLTLRVNGLKTYNEYRYTMKEIYYVNQDKLDSLILQYREAQSIV